MSKRLITTTYMKQARPIYKFTQRSLEKVNSSIMKYVVDLSLS